MSSFINRAYRAPERHSLFPKPIRMSVVVMNIGLARHISEQV